MPSGHARDPSSWIMFIILFHIMLNLFSIIGSFGIAPQLGQTMSEWGIGDVSSFLLGGFWSGLLTGGVVVAVLGTTSYLTGRIEYGIIFGIISGLFVNTWIKMSSIITQMASSMAGFAIIGYFFAVVISTVFTYVVINGVLQTMAPTQFGR